MEQNKDTDKSVPLDLVIQTARKTISNAVDSVTKETGLPAYLIDGIISEIISEVRRKEIYEFSVQCAEVKGGE